MRPYSTWNWPIRIGEREISMSLSVVKFGGTSMGSTESMLACASIVLSDPARKVAIVSATSGTTNLLVQLSQTVLGGSWSEAKALVSQIQEKHLKMGEELGLNFTATQKLEELLSEVESMARGMTLLKEASARACDALFGLGERISSLLFAQALNKAGETKKIGLINSMDFIKTDNNHGQAEPQVEQIKSLAQEKLVKLLAAHDVLVGQGFIGSTEEGIPTTLGRGGSDYSASLYGEALNAKVVEIWTDVSGVSTTDPRMVSQAYPIKELSFEEAAELATFGAKVLHPASLWPAIRNYIPVFVGNSFEPQAAGTWVRTKVEHQPAIRALASRRNQVLLTVTSPKMLQAHGFLAKIFSTLATHNISVDLVTTSEISVALTIDKPNLLSKEVVLELEEFAKVDIQQGLGLIAVVGNDISTSTGIVSKVFEQLGEDSIRLICQGASAHNLCFLVNDERVPEIINRLHSTFLEQA